MPCLYTLAPWCGHTGRHAASAPLGWVDGSRVSSSAPPPRPLFTLHTVHTALQV